MKILPEEWINIRITIWCPWNMMALMWMSNWRKARAEMLCWIGTRMLGTVLDPSQQQGTKMDFLCEGDFLHFFFFLGCIFGTLKKKHRHSLWCIYQSTMSWARLHALVNQETGSSLLYFQIPKTMEEGLTAFNGGGIVFHNAHLSCQIHVQSHTLLCQTSCNKKQTHAWCFGHT